MLQKTKTELDDFVDTLELFSNLKFRKDLGQGLKEAREGKAIKMSLEDLRKRMRTTKTMMSYSSEFTPIFLRLLKKLDPQARERRTSFGVVYEPKTNL